MLGRVITNMDLAFVQVPGTEFPKPLEFPKWGEIMAFCYVTRVTFFRKSPKEGGWLPGDPTLRLGGWNFQSQQRPPPSPPRRGEALEIKLNCRRPMTSSIMPIQRSLHKNPQEQSSASSRPADAWREWPAEGPEARCPAPLPHALPWAALPSGCSWVAFF